MWIEVIFTNIHKMSNAFADSFDRYIKLFISCTMYEKKILLLQIDVSKEKWWI